MLDLISASSGLLSHASVELASLTAMLALKMFLTWPSAKQKYLFYMHLCTIIVNFNTFTTLLYYPKSILCYMYLLVLQSITLLETFIFFSF